MAGEDEVLIRDQGRVKASTIEDNAHTYSFTGALSVGSVACMTTTADTVEAADNTNSAKRSVVGIVQSVDGSSCSVVSAGGIATGLANLSPGSVYWAGSSGSLQSPKPAADALLLGVAISDTAIAVACSPTDLAVPTVLGRTQIESDSSGDYSLLVDNDNSSAGHGLKVTSDGTGAGTNLLDLESVSTTLFRFRADGRLGIGTTSPTVKLDVVGNMQASGDLYVDKIRRATDSGTTTKILLNDESIKIYAGHSSDNVCAVDTTGLKVHGSLALSVLSINSANDPGPTYTITSSNCVILVNTRVTNEGGIDSAIVLTLPDAGDNPGMVVTVKDAAGYSNVNRIFVAPLGNDKIDGTISLPNNIQIPTIGGWMKFVSDGVGSWAQIGG